MRGLSKVWSPSSSLLPKRGSTWRASHASRPFRQRSTPSGTISRYLLKDRTLGYPFREPSRCWTVSATITYHAHRSSWPPRRRPCWGDSFRYWNLAKADRAATTSTGNSVDQTTNKRRDLFRELPDPNRAIVAGCGEQLSIARESDSLNRARMCRENSLFLSAIGVPQPDRAVVTG